ncbi:methyltransferase-like protein 7A [Trichonephila clavipes]|uniref:Methyltransferase-like protein 7A n=1 Tax=Trichonephila clavipes TaxID=2585209 RepID=A0A8X6W427_TRICX|nr:methyltransferase-like protein 7A [Trichonephila clavipes]
MKKITDPQRREAFELLKKHLGDRKKKTPHEILEIGIGDGANLEYYPGNSSLTALDMTESFEPYLKENLKNYPEIRYRRKVIAMAENMVGVEDSSVDVVVCTYTMCSVTSIPSVLKEVKRVLKSGGKFLFLEHVSYPKSNWNYLLQVAVAPLWSTYYGGCKVKQRTGEEIRKTGFSNVDMETTYDEKLLLFSRPQILGVATKKTTRREDRRIVRQALVDPTGTRSTIRADVGVAIVPQTISRHLAEANFKSKRLFRALPLTPEHRQLRLQWCQARSMWNVTDWQKVVFSDESWFVLGIYDTVYGCGGALHVWDQLKRQMPSCHSVHDLELAVQVLWAHLPQDNIRCLINSMPDREAACIAAGDGPTRY